MFWPLRVSVTGVLDEVYAGGRNQTGTAPLHVLTMTTWSQNNAEVMLTRQPWSSLTEVECH